MILGICDDDKKWRKHARKILESFAFVAQVNIKIVEFSDSEELFAYDENPLDALFLDIELGSENGIFVARELNRYWGNCKVIYMTNYIFYATEVYNTEHIWFVLKEQFEDKVGDIVNRLLHEIDQKEQRFVMETPEKNLIAIAPADICYVERERRTTKISTIWGNYQVIDKLETIIPQLSEVDFSRCHSSIIVHFRYVRELQKDSYLLYNGDTVQISRRYAKTTREDFLRWSVLQM